MRPRAVEVPLPPRVEVADADKAHYASRQEKALAVIRSFNVPRENRLIIEDAIVLSGYRKGTISHVPESGTFAGLLDIILGATEDELTILRAEFGSPVSA